jgi:hypothetical protein
MADSQAPATIAGDMLHGVEEIGEFLGLTHRQAYHVLAAGHLRSAFQLGRSWHARRSALLAEIEEKERRASQTGVAA